jgi:hypothetical protein
VLLLLLLVPLHTLTAEILSIQGSLTTRVRTRGLVDQRLRPRLTARRLPSASQKLLLTVRRLLNASQKLLLIVRRLLNASQKLQPTAHQPPAASQKLPSPVLPASPKLPLTTHPTMSLLLSLTASRLALRHHLPLHTTPRSADPKPHLMAALLLMEAIVDSPLRPTSILPRLGRAPRTSSSICRRACRGFR